MASKDDYYGIEVRLAPKNVWFTPDEARKYYGRYSREGITIHWWGGGEQEDKHDNIVNFFLRRTNGSVNYILSDRKITLMVGPDNVAWTSQSGNPTTISIEHEPGLNDEGYKKSGWLVDQLQERYGRRLTFYPHKYWYPTACPGTISLDRIRQETDKWARGEYTQPSPPPPVPSLPAPPPVANIEWVKFDKVRRYICNKQPTNLWNFNSTTWPGVKSVKPFNQGDVVDIYGYATNHTLKATYLITEYSFTKKIPNGINVVDMTLEQQPTPPPIQIPPPPEPEKPEWEKNLRDIDDTKFWLKEDAKLIDITTGNSFKRLDGSEVILKKDSEFVCSALTSARGTEYRMTDYSFQKQIYNGIPIDKLTLTPPGVPDLSPVPDNPDLKINWLVAAVLAIWDFLKRKFPS